MGSCSWRNHVPKSVRRQLPSHGRADIGTLCRVARTPKPLTSLDLAVVERLASVSADLGVSQREIAQRAQMSLNRVGIILRGETPPASLGEVGAIGRALGLTATEVIADAEEAVAAREREAVSQDGDTEATSSHGDTVPDRAGDGREAERDRIAVLIAAGVDPYELGLAASRGRGTAKALEETTGWRDDLGEESQVGPEEE